MSDHLNIFLTSSHSKGAFALDIGFGCGKFSLILAQNGYVVDALDLNKENTDSLRKRIESLSVNIFCEPIEKFSLEKNKYSIILARNIFPFIKDKKSVEEIIQSLTRALVVGGKIHFTLFGRKDEWFQKKQNMSFFDYEEIIPLLEKVGLSITFQSTEEGWGPTMNGNIKYWNIHRYFCEKV